MTTEMSQIETLDALLRVRFSCRAFMPDAVPEAIAEQIVATAQRVPSWCNAQPWQVVLTRRAETDRLRTALYAHAGAAAHASDIPFPKAYTGAYQQRRRDCGWALYEAVGVKKGDRDGSARQMMENFRLFGAPHLALITTEADLGAYGVLDCGAFVTAFCLAAQALGVATIPQAALAGFSPFLRDWFDLPAARHVVCGISFGFADTDHPANGFRTNRAGPAEVISWRGDPLP
jgi:nitroreductase